MTELPDWMRGQVLLGKHDDEYVVVKLEEDGELNVLLKGAYDDELRTVKLDDQGRLSAFVIDSVDAWGRMLNVGNAELAARLGSVSRHDRRGLIRDYCTFEDGFSHVYPEPDAFGSAVVLAVDPVCTGGYSGELQLRAAVGAWAQIHLARGPLPVTALGLEVAYHVGDNKGWPSIWIQQWTGARTVIGAIRHHIEATSLEYYGTDLDWHEFASPVIISYSFDLWTTIKVVIDADSEKYVRCLWGNHEYDLSAYDLYGSNSVLAPRIEAKVRAENREAVARSVWFDDIILTSAEP